MAFFDLLQQLLQIVVVERQRAHQQRVQYHAARPHVCLSAVVFFALIKKILLYFISLYRFVHVVSKRSLESNGINNFKMGNLLE